MDELILPLLSTRWGRNLGIALLLTLVLLIVVTLVGSAISLRSDLRLSELPVKAKQEPLAENRLEQLIQRIPENHLFGKYGVDGAVLPITSLELHLVGVIQSVPESFSRVIISESNQPGKIYKVGDVLPSSGVRIYTITKDGVILENHGRYEKLPLQRAPLQFQGMPQPLSGE